MLVDQMCMSPFGLAVFFTFMTFAEGGGKKALKHKFVEVSSPIRASQRLTVVTGLSPHFEGQLLCMACSANHQLQFHASVSPNPLRQYRRCLLVCSLIPACTHVDVDRTMYLSLENSSVEKEGEF